MELDHLFLFTDTPHEAAGALRAFGLEEGTPNIHPGQGTACRRFFFHNAYLELVWVHDEDEIRNGVIAPARLWERSQHRSTGYNPFGLCFRDFPQRATDVFLLFKDGWRYHAPFLPPGAFANIGKNEAYPSEPMLFEMPFFGLSPAEYPAPKKQPLVHRRSFEQMTKVTLTRPAGAAGISPSMEKVLEHGFVTLSEGTGFSATLQFDGGKEGGSKDFHPLMPLVFNW